MPKEMTSGDSRLGVSSAEKAGNPPPTLRRHPDVELNSNFVFGPDARFSRRRDPEIGLLHDRLPDISTVL